jgi:hypothetical protein
LPLAVEAPAFSASARLAKGGFPVTRIAPSPSAISGVLSIDPQSATTTSGRSGRTDRDRAASIARAT